MTAPALVMAVRASVFRTIGYRPLPCESLLPAELLRLPQDLARVEALLDDQAFFALHFHPVPSRATGYPNAH